MNNDWNVTGVKVERCIFLNEDTPTERSRYAKWLASLPPDIRRWHEDHPPAWDCLGTQEGQVTYCAGECPITIA